ncbi:MAG TPA: terminase family protein [Dissulfurispiraceae bacterium]|nr:terminase family protein [Dissulfurispiraceae bacterium]
MKLSERGQFLVDNLDLPAASGVDDARWEHFQLSHLSDDSTFRIEDKSRQIAWSFLTAAEAIADAVLHKQGTIFVSINLEEATEKIRYGRAVYENLNIRGLPNLVRDNQLSLEFDNGARLISLPSRPPRGKARMNVVLDEFAHVQHDRDIYTAALPIISKGGRLRIGSSPMGASGIFSEVFSETLRAYPGYKRKRTPWWEVHSFCRNVKLARQMAPAMETAQRVELFGSDRIKAVYANMIEDDFRQEYECEFVDEATAWISWELIQRNQRPDHHWYHAKTVDQALHLIDVILEDIQRGRVEYSLAGGLDIGRKRDLTEFMALGKSTSGHLPLRLSISLDKVQYDDQERCFTEVISRLPFTNVLVDQNGIGGQLAENLERTGRAQGVNFTNESKELWAVEARLQVERANTPLPADRDIAYQIHSIRKKVTAAKNNVFDTEGNEKHHADKFWAWALAIWAANKNQTGSGFVMRYT